MQAMVKAIACISVIALRMQSVGYGLMMSFLAVVRFARALSASVTL